MQKISIAMATFNGEKYIREQIESILNQTYSCFELVIVDDFSKDKTINILKSYSDPRIKIIRNNKNIGCTKSFEKAVLSCSGSFIALCDQDDIWSDNKLESLFNKIGSSDLIYSDCNIIDKNNVIIEASYAKYKNPLVGLDSSSDSFEIISAFNSFVLGCSLMFRAEWTPFITPIMDDTWNHDKWIVFIIALGGEVRYLDQQLFKYRIHDSNQSMIVKDRSTLEKIRTFIVKKPKAQTFKKESLVNISNKRLKRIAIVNELLVNHRKGRIYFFCKYYKYMLLRSSGLASLRYIIIWLLNPHFYNQK